MRSGEERIRSYLWDEEPEADNPFAARACYCAGFDLFGDLLGKASWAEYLYLLFQREPPTAWQAALLEDLALILANPGPRDLSVRAAMNGAVGQSPAAAALIAALAVGTGQYGGAREVVLAMELWQSCGLDLAAWQRLTLESAEDDRPDIWLSPEHLAGFDPNGVSTPTPVRQTLAHFTAHYADGALGWLQQHRLELELVANAPLAMSGVAAAACFDLGLMPEQAEMLYLLLRLPGAAAHALEQYRYGWVHYPFFKQGLIVGSDPGPFVSEGEADETS